MDKPLAAVIADLTHETASWSSLDVRITLEQTIHVALGDVAPGTTLGGWERYAATATGQRLYAQYSRVRDRDVCVLLGYADGKRCAAVRFEPPPHADRQRSITITPTFLHEATTGTAELPASLPFFVGLAPLRDAIRTAESVGPSQAAGRDCTRYYFPAVRTAEFTQDLVYHLDGATSVPLRVESFANRDRFARGEPTTVWEATRLDEVQGYHVATDSRFVTWLDRGAAGRTPQLTNTYHVAAIRYDDPIPAATFWPKYDPGVFVNNLIAGTHYFNTPDKKAPPQPARQVVESTASPIGTTAPTDWTPWLSGAGLVLGGALLVGGVLVWLRSR